jgi:protein O-mannosyl-transferase
LQGALGQSENVLRQLLAINPGAAAAQRSLANVLAAQGKLDEAVGYYRLALQTQPHDGDLNNGLGMALMLQGKSAEAEQPLLIAAEEQPTNWVAASQLALLFQSRNQMARAVEFYHRTLKLQPNLAAALNNLAWILASDPDAKLRNGTEAVGLAEHVCELTQYKNPVFLGTLAAAYAEAGRFSHAVTWAEKSRDLALAAGNQPLADRSAKLAEQFRAGRTAHWSARSPRLRLSPSALI